MKLNILVLLLAMVVIPAASQTPAQRPRFEVASIKPSDPTQRSGSIMTQPGGRLVITGMPLRELVKFAYGLQDFQLEGGPAWARTDLWNVEARADAAPSNNPPDRNPPNMLAIRLQSLLEDRFQLSTHRESRDVPVYELMISKRGSKMKLSADQTPPKPREPGEPQSQPVKPNGPMDRFSMRVDGRGSLEAVAFGMPNIVQALSSMAHRTVIDKTGLTGLYDVKLQWTPENGAVPSPTAGPVAPEPPSDRDNPSLFTALEEQLGLKFESSKGPVEVLVIDSVSKPSEN